LLIHFCIGRLYGLIEAKVYPVDRKLSPRLPHSGL
jgi:hypothetical protein